MGVVGEGWGEGWGGVLERVEGGGGVLSKGKRIYFTIEGRRGLRAG